VSKAVEKKHKLVIIGDTAFAEIAYEYFTYDSQYEVVAFCVERAYLRREQLFDLPVIAFEDMADLYQPGQHSFFAANVYTQRNQLRTRLYLAAKAQGFTPASYVSSKAFVWRNCKIGEHCFIFENNVVQPFVRLGDNVVLWSGNHIGHHSSIGDNCFVSSHVVVSGFCQIGTNCFMGVNSTVANNLSIGNDCIIGAAALVVGDVGDNQTVVGIWKKKKEPAS
jgi:sugar O-acyltransferase (sialic acid O-acetyltransferase NeuD family)